MKNIIHTLTGPDNITRKLLIGSQNFTEMFFNNYTITKDSILISITNPGEPIAKIHEIKHLYIFRMQFWDIDKNTINLKAPNQASFNGLKKFIDTHRKVSNIFIHCGAGISRSAAVAWSICDYLQLTDLQGNKFDKYALLYYVPKKKKKNLCDIALQKGEPDEWYLLQK